MLTSIYLLNYASSKWFGWIPPFRGFNCTTSDNRVYPVSCNSSNPWIKLLSLPNSFPVLLKQKYAFKATVLIWHGGPLLYSNRQSQGIYVILTTNLGCDRRRNMYKNPTKVISPAAFSLLYCVCITTFKTTCKTFREVRRTLLFGWLIFKWKHWMWHVLSWLLWILGSLQPLTLL